MSFPIKSTEPTPFERWLAVQARVPPRAVKTLRVKEVPGSGDNYEEYRVTEHLVQHCGFTRKIPRKEFQHPNAAPSNNSVQQVGNSIITPKTNQST